MLKENLINELLQSPEDFSSEKINQLIGLIPYPMAKPNGSENGASTPALMTANTLVAPPVTKNDISEKKEIISREDLIEIVRRIFDMNSLTSFGKANDGLMGKLNRRSEKKRLKRFNKKIRKNPNAIKIYAEGDSWFEHPLIREIIDWMRILHDGNMGKKIARWFKKKKRKNDIAIYSSAYGGDWLTNIIHEGKYITDISLIQPQVILLSGGGNDVVGEKKIAMMIDSKGYEEIELNQYLAKEFGENFREDFAKLNFAQKRTEILAIFEKNNLLSKLILTNDQSLKDLNDEQFSNLVLGMSYLSKDFFAFLWAFELLYKYVINQITRKHKDVKIITQGYDYPVPTSKRGPLFTKKFPFIQLRKTVLNWGMDNGHWLKDAISLRGIGDPRAQKSITMAIIHLFNDMLIRVGQDGNLNAKLHHIDSRGLAKPDDWFDEMHLNPKLFKKVAAKYLEAILNDNAPKVLKVKE